MRATAVRGGGPWIFDPKFDIWALFGQNQLIFKPTRCTGVNKIVKVSTHIQLFLKASWLEHLTITAPFLPKIICTTYFWLKQSCIDPIECAVHPFVPLLFYCFCCPLLHFNLKIMMAVMYVGWAGAVNKEHVLWWVGLSIISLSTSLINWSINFIHARTS